MDQHCTTNSNGTIDLTATARDAAALIAFGRPTRAAWYEAASHSRWLARQIGPRRVYGIYRNGSSGDVYEVLELDRGPRSEWPFTWQITVLTFGAREVRRHSTAWANRDRVLAEPGPAADNWRAAYARAVTAGDVDAARRALDSADRTCHPLAPGYTKSLALTATTATEALR